MYDVMMYFSLDSSQSYCISSIFTLLWSFLLISVLSFIDFSTHCIQLAKIALVFSTFFLKLYTCSAFIVLNMVVIIFTFFAGIHGPQIFFILSSL